MRLEAGDLAVVSDNTHKKYLVQVVGHSHGTYTGVIDNEWRGTAQQQQMTFEKEDILAVMPTMPTIGKVYNIKVEPWLKREIMQPWGEINYYRHLADAETNYIRQVLKYIGYLLQQARLTSGLPITVEIRNKSSHMDGYYKYVTRPGKTDVLCLCPESITEELYHYIFHEFGHHLWYRHYSNELKVRWINLYHQTVKIETASRDRLQQLYQDFANSTLFISGYRKFLKESQDDNGLALFNLVLAYIKKVHHLTARNVDILHGEGGNALVDYWPKTALELSKVASVVSDYGTKNVEEYHSESFAFACMNMAPQNIVRAVMISLQNTGGMLPAMPTQQQQAA